MALYLLNQTREDVNIGPSQWREIILHLHVNAIQSEIVKNYQNQINSLFKAHEYETIAESFILSEHYFKKLFVFIYFEIVRKQRNNWRLWIARMGGDIITCDMTYSVFDKIFGFQDSQTVTDQNKSEWYQEENKMDCDSRYHSLQIKVGTLTLQNYAHFSFDEVLIPRASEKHCYVAPEIGIFIGYLCKYSEHGINRLNIKHDGFESGLNLDVKCGYCTKAIFGEKIENESTGEIIDINNLIHNLSV